MNTPLKNCKEIYEYKYLDVNIFSSFLFFVQDFNRRGPAHQTTGEQPM